MSEEPEHPKPEIEYPCEWRYKVIGPDDAELRAAITSALGPQTERAYNVTLSHTSNRGNYCCLNVDLVVYTEEDRVSIFEHLRDHPATKVVL